MSDSIIVRVTLDSYDMASTGKQTQVYVQVPEVGRCSWLLPEEVFHGLKDRAWPEVLDVAHDYITYGGAASNSSSTAAWRAIREWLLDDANRDEMQAAFEEHHALRDPVARKLRAQNEELRSRIAELEAAADAAWTATCDHEGHAVPHSFECPESPERPPLTVFRASHDSIAMGLYTTAAAAREHCEAEERSSWPTGTNLAFDWIEDEEDGVAELTVQAGQNEESVTGYVVTPLEVASAYDEEADE
jgi:hypothetical protein